MITLEHLSFFIDFINDEYSELIQKISRYLTRGEITYELLWAILLPRTPMYTECAITGEPRISWLVEVKEEISSYQLQCQGVEYNTEYNGPGGRNKGAKFGLAYIDVSPIREFKGAVKINSLSTHPFEYHQDAEKLVADLLTRGEKWESLHDRRHVHYAGEAYCPTGGISIERIYVS